MLILSNILSLDSLLTLATLVFLEIVLGIDNIVMISILSEKLPKKEQKKARKYGILFAAITRIGLLFTLSWIATLTTPILIVDFIALSYKDIFFIIGGLFLLYKTLPELFEMMGLKATHVRHRQSKGKALMLVIVQIAVLDIVFSLDSVITALGLSQYIWIMVVSILAAVVVMLVFSHAVTIIIEKYQSIKVLALCFLALIAAIIILEGFHIQVSRNYIFSMIVFSLMVEMINIRIDHHNAKEKNSNK